MHRFVRIKILIIGFCSLFYIVIITSFQDTSKSLYVVVIVGCSIFTLIIGSSTVACAIVIVLHKFLKKKQKTPTTEENTEMQSPNNVIYEEVGLENKEDIELSSNVAYEVAIVNAPH